MVRSIPLKKILYWCARLLLGGTFAVAASLKISYPGEFVTDINHYHLLPYPVATIVGVYLPWLELICAIGVLFRRRERGALILMMLMCGVFFLALASAWFRGLDISCGCFGHNRPATLLTALLRSFVLGSVALVLFRQCTEESVEPHTIRPSTAL